MPLSLWLRDPLHDWALSRIKSEHLASAGINVQVAEELLEEHRRREADHARALWTLIVLSEWLAWDDARTKSAT